MFTYDPAVESRSVVDIADHYDHFIGGEFVASDSDVRIDVVNPATGEHLTSVAAGSSADVDRAVRAARRAYDRVWGPMPATERAKYLYRIGRLLQERSREFAVLETIDNGKPIRETRDVDVPLAAAHFIHHAGWADKLHLVSPGAVAHGVVGQVIPWNFPLLMLAWKVAPALAAGNTVVLKPAESTPLSALAFADICRQAGLPAGVVNIVTGAGSTGANLVEHRGIDKLAFTGSTEVGRRIAQVAARTGRPLTLELGGKGANIVFADSSLDEVVEGVVNGIFFNQGQVCCAGSRLLVEESAHDELLDRLRARVDKIRVGDPLDKNTDMGAIVSAEQLERVGRLTATAEKEGAQRWSSSCALPSAGFWFAPTILTSVSPSMSVAREEIFGPVLSVLTFRTPAEALDKANNTPYGLSAGVWTDKGAKALWMAERLRAGVVWLNSFNRFDPASPFGGFKESGWGREGGRHGMAAYLRTDSDLGKGEQR